MEPDNAGEVEACLRERRVVKVSPDGERSISCTETCPLEACRRGVSGARTIHHDAAEGRSCGGLISPLVTALDSELSVNEALAVLDAARVTTAPVVDDNMVLVGVVSVCELHLAQSDRDAEVEDAMTMAVVAVSTRASVAEIALVMDQHNVENVPVVGTEGELLGMVTAMDLVRWFRRYMALAKPGAEDSSPSASR
jgi:CBS domain-containing protein